jgi:hypothetical protein
MPALLRVRLPQAQQRQEVGLLVAERRVLLVRLGLLVGRPVARIRHPERGDDDRDLGDAALLCRGEQDAREARIERQPGQPPAGLGQAQGVIERAELLQAALSVAHVTPVGWLDERKALDVAEPQRVHLQDDRREIGAQDLRLGELVAREEILLGIQPDRDAGTHAPATAGALLRRGTRDLLDGQALQATAVAVAAHPRKPGVDHRANARHRQRGLRDVGGQDYAAPAGRPEHALLLGLRQPRVQRQDLATLGMALAQRLGRLADLALAAEEHQDVARLLAPQLFHGTDDRGLLRVVGLVTLLVLHRPVAHFDRVAAPGDVDDRRAAEVPRKAFGVDRRRSDDQLQVAPPRQQPREIAHQEIDVEAALVRLVEDERVVPAQLAIVLRFGEQDAVGHQLDQALGPRAVLEADLVAHALPERLLQLLGDARGDGARSDAPRLRVTDVPVQAAPGLEADLRQLRRLARAGLAADHHHLVGEDGVADLGPPRADGQLLGVLERRHAGRARGATGAACVVGGWGLRQVREPALQPTAVASISIRMSGWKRLATPSSVPAGGQPPTPVKRRATSPEAARYAGTSVV